MRIATYTRISTDEAHQPYSLEAQSERLGAYAKSQEDWKIVRRFTDQASGASLERPGLERALQEAAAKRFDLFLKRLQCVHIPAGNNQVRACSRECSGKCLTQAAAGAGHDGDLACETERSVVHVTVGVPP